MNKRAKCHTVDFLLCYAVYMYTNSLEPFSCAVYNAAKDVNSVYKK